ncbi:MAG: leucine-rich repeat domain-containing protein [Prevotella sp.]|nr:leucine-rich repeat domain-containing protein [Prevotella sp.]
MLMSMVGLNASAHDIAVKNADGVTIYYNYINNSTKLAVTYQGSSSSSFSNEYTGNVVIPESVTYNGNTYSVTSIGNYAFDGCSMLTSITIPNSVTSIGNWAFFYCSNLTSITIPESVTSIGEHAFHGCSGLTSITIPNSVTSIGDGVYNSCSGLTSITIPNGVTSIGEWAFSDCSGLTSITIPNSVTSIGEWAFYRCSGLTSITIPNSVTNIGARAFYGCSGLTSITIPNSVTTIGKGAFADCSAITSIKVQEENTKYDSREDCNAVVETASNTLVVGCKSSVIPNNVTSIGESAFENCAGLTSIIIPNSVTSIEKDAFEDCRDLTSLSLGENVKSIGVRAFNQCTALTSISIPNSVTSIETDAFDDCTALTSIYSYIENPTNNTGSNFDSSNYTNATLYVPFGTKDKYLATDGWKNFVNIVEMDETAVKEISASNTNEAKYYSLDGKHFSQPQKGLNILKMSDGTTRKVMK